MLVKRHRDESGAGGIVIAAILYPILGLVVMALMLSLQGWSSAQANADGTADQVAKAAASQVVTTPSGEIGIDCEKAEAAAFVAFSNSRSVATGGDRFSSFDSDTFVVDGASEQVADGAAGVEVRCVEPFEVTLPAYNYCPDVGGWEMMEDGETCRRQLEDRFEYFCATEGSTLIGSQCVTLATIWECEDGRIVDQNAECGQELATALCPIDPVLTSDLSSWGGWTLSPDKETCQGVETSYYSPVIDFDCAAYWVSAPSTLLESDSNCFEEPKEYYCTVGVLSGSACRYADDVRSPLYTCPAGTSLSGTSCVQTTVWYTCPNGGSLSGTSCFVQTATYPYAHYVWVCPSGWSRVSDSLCQQLSGFMTGAKGTTCSSLSGSFGSRWAGGSWNSSTRKCTYRVWNYSYNATLQYRQGSVVYVTTSYAAQYNSNTSSSPAGSYCQSGYVREGASCVRYAFTSTSIRSTGDPQLLGAARRIVVSPGPPTLETRGPVDSVSRTYTPIRPTAEEITIFDPAPERQTNTEPLFEDRQFVTSASTETFYRSVQVRIQDSYSSPVGGALEADISRTAKASVEQQRSPVVVP